MSGCHLALAFDLDKQMLRHGLRAFSRPISTSFRLQPITVVRFPPQLARTRTMSSHGFGESTLRPKPDAVLQDIADYVHDYNVSTDLAWETARLCLIDTIGCGLEGLRFPQCERLMGPVVPGTVVPNGMYVPPRVRPLAHLSKRNKNPGNKLPARPHSGCLQHRNHDPMARLQ